MARKFTLVLLLALGAPLAAPAAAHAQKLVYVVRHAERADEPKRDQQDPSLSAAGEARAARLRDMLANADVKAIYVTEFKRTQETAAPLAARVHLKPETMPLSTDAFTAALKSRHANDVVLIVAHSSTIPAIVKALTGHAVQVGDDDYTNLFVVVPATQTVSTIRY